LAEANCVGCHAIEGDDDSSHPDAPPFRVLSSIYPIDAFEELFSEGIVTDHKDMPLFKMTPLQLTDMISYITTLPREPGNTEEQD
jgi:mono/diheme cytochrome c family protein